MDAYTGGAWRSVGSADVYIDGQWRRLTRSEQYVGGAWKTGDRFLIPLTLSGPADVSGFGYIYVTTDNATVTTNGGLAPYTYSWTRLSGSYGSPISATSATTAFIANPPSGSIRTSVFRCTVTDSLGSTATADVTVYFEEVGLS
jgi:hypothetical protein